MPIVPEAWTAVLAVAMTARIRLSSRVVFISPTPGGVGWEAILVFKTIPEITTYYNISLM
jgi:hypothetical protein